ncbi:acyl-CoA synthetase [Paracoccus sulfuroxidans]|uniref:Acetyl-CoA synthetase n=1 Tax=Paracoccus sulfuroxidans TaxID=384678 RepID=A0A562NLH6_9RHOB|nr:AMP-binding protein [Paracoccus sulfuroxidans]TWI32920.1 acetyl-CoA synthetase [Paracoccus sulfuroxidans]
MQAPTRHEQAAQAVARLMASPRDYDQAVKDYRFECPEYFNYAYDVIDDIGANRDKVAVITVSGDGSQIGQLNYSDLSRRSSRFANALDALGLKKGDFAVLVAGRIPEWYDAIFGCMKMGVVSLPGTTQLTAKDIAYRVNAVGARAVIVSPEHCGKVDQIRADCPSLEYFIVLGGPVEGWTSSQEITETAADTVPEDRRPETRRDDVMMGYFTSGTTGMPKMVPRDYSYALAHASTALFWMDLTRDDVHWTLTDTGWAKAAWGMLFPQFLAECTVVLFNGTGFDADLHLRLVGKLGVNTFCAPPTVYRAFAQMDLSGYDLSSIRRSLGAGEPLNPEVIRFWKDSTGTTIADGYGQTETLNIIGNFPGKPVKIGATGLPVPGLDMRVVDDAGNETPQGEVGNIAMRVTEPWPPGLFTGYFTANGPDRKAFRNGWYYTGDTARRDEDGYFWFVGRADDLITSSGYRISPFEVESTLLEHDAVAESAVIGEPDPERGEIVSAYIILMKGIEPSDDLVKNIQSFCRERTAPYKYPRKVTFVTELPKTISGKIRRVELRARS